MLFCYATRKMSLQVYRDNTLSNHDAIDINIRVCTDPGKVWKVMEFIVEIFRVWKIMHK